MSNKNFYCYKRRWYHLSTTLTKIEEYLIPWNSETAYNRCYSEPEGCRICVAPTIEQCLTAIPYHLTAVCQIYKTKEKLKATCPINVFDSKVTQEGWLLHPTCFIRIGTIELEDVERGLKIDHVISESASKNEPRYSGKVLKWWQRAKIERFIKHNDVSTTHDPKGSVLAGQIPSIRLIDYSLPFH